MKHLDLIHSEFLQKASSLDESRIKLVDNIQSEFTKKASDLGITLSADQSALLEKIAARRKKIAPKKKKQLMSKKAPAKALAKSKTKDAGSFDKEMGDVEINNPDPKGHKPRVKIRSLKSGEKGSVQLRTYEQLYRQWAKGKGKPAVKEHNKVQVLRTKMELAKKRMKEIKERERELKQKEKELAKKTKEPEKAKEPVKDSEKHKEFTKWWESLSKDRQDSYLKRHPKSKLESLYHEVKEKQKVKPEMQQVVEEDKNEKQLAKDIDKQVDTLKAIGDKNNKKYKQTAEMIKRNENKLPIDVSFMKDPPPPSKVKTETVQNDIKSMNNAFKALKIDASIVDANDSPNVITYSVKLDTKEDDPKYPLLYKKLTSGESADVVESIVRKEGITVKANKEKGTVEFSVPKGKEFKEGERDPVLAKELFASDDFVRLARDPRHMPTVVGVDSDNKPLILDRSRSEAAHTLLSGTTGSGKSVAMHTMISSDITGKKPEELKVVLIDVAKAGKEFGAYENVAHLGLPVAKDEASAIDALEKVRQESEDRDSRLAKIKIGDIPIPSIEAYNTLITKDPNKMTAEEREAYDGIPENERIVMPYLNVYVDEAADLLEKSKQSRHIRDLIDSTLKVARSAGIHFTIATQSPAKSFIDGTLQKNLTTKLMLRLTDKTDADNVDVPEATKLLANGDGVFVDANGKRRIQTAYMSDDERNNIIQHAKGKQQFIQQKPKDEKATIETPEFTEFRRHMQDVRDSLEVQRQKLMRMLSESAEREKELTKRRQEAESGRFEEKERSDILAEAERARERRLRQQTSEGETATEIAEPEIPESVKGPEIPESVKEPEMPELEEPEAVEEGPASEEQTRKEIEDLLAQHEKPITEEDIEKSKSEKSEAKPAKPAKAKPATELDKEREEQQKEGDERRKSLMDRIKNIRNVFKKLK